MPWENGFVTRRRVHTLTLFAALAVGTAGCGASTGSIAPPRDTPLAARLPVSTGTPAPAARPGPLTARIQPPTSGSPGTAPIVVRFSSPIATQSPLPTVTPAIPGSWKRSGSTLTFVPVGAFPPQTAVQVSVPASVRAADGATLSQPVSAHYSTGAGSVTRLQQMLATLGYLPVAFTPTGQPPTTLAGEQAANFAPLPGGFSWRWPGAMSALQAGWLPGSSGPITRGALMAFQRVSGLPVTGQTTAAVWSALDAAVAAGRTDPAGYSWVDVVKGTPETLTLWHNGRVVLTAAANTGIPGYATPNGSFDVYLRYQQQVMRGKNPNGSSYADPVSWVSYFYGGDAVHGFVRASYGFRQSLGCVELPPATAGVVWPYTPRGTVVTIQP